MVYHVSFSLLILVLVAKHWGREWQPTKLQYSCLENSMVREALGLQSMGLQRVWHDSAPNNFTFTKAYLTFTL